MRLTELVSEGPIDSIKNSWNAGANAAHKLATPSRWLEPSGSAPSAPAQKNPQLQHWGLLELTGLMPLQFLMLLTQAN
jgi:hypothetical protein